MEPSSGPRDGKRMRNPSPEHPEEGNITAGKTGGEKTNTHRHWLPMGKEAGLSGFSSRTIDDIAMRSGAGKHSIILEDAFTSDGNWTEQTTYNETINIMSPYIAVYIWRRTA